MRGVRGVRGGADPDSQTLSLHTLLVCVCVSPPTPPSQPPSPAAPRLAGALTTPASSQCVGPDPHPCAWRGESCGEGTTRPVPGQGRGPSFVHGTK